MDGEWVCSGRTYDGWMDRQEDGKMDGWMDA